MLTKSLADQYLAKYKRSDLCLVITRPAAVSATDKVPFPGWTDSIGAGGGVMYGLGKGTIV